MSKLGINTGNNPNDGQGDPLRVAMGKINSNFTEIYNTLGDGNNVISYASTAGISTVARNLTNNPIINVSGILNTGITTTEHLEVRNIESTGIITAVQFSGDGSQLTNVTSTAAGISIYDDGVLLGVAREIDFDVNLVSTSPDGTQRVRVSSQASYATTAGIATYATSAGSASIAGYATTAGISTVARGLTGTPNLNVGVVTATSFVGDGSGLTGVVGSGSGVVIQEEGSPVGTAGTINFVGTGVTATSSGGIATVQITTDSQWVPINLPGDGLGTYGQPLGIHTTKHVGIGRTADSATVLYIESATVGSAGTPFGLRVDGFADINNVKFDYTNNGYTRFLFPGFLNTVGGAGNGYGSAIQYDLLDSVPFHVRLHSKFTKTVQIGTSFYNLGDGPILYPGIFMDGGSATIAVGLGITINGGTGIITATGFSGGAAGVNVSGAITATSFFGNGSGLTGISLSLTDLSDVNAGAPSTGQVLKWSGSEWQAASDLTAAGAGIGLSDLSITINPPGISSLTYNNTTGVFQFTPIDINSYLTNVNVSGALTASANIRAQYYDLTGIGQIGYGGTYLTAFANSAFDIVTDTVAQGEGAPYWRFGTDGSITFPDSTVQTTAYTGAAVGSAGTWAVNAAGIHTTKNVGIGTALSSSALTVEGDGRFSGIVTASRFESTSAGTPTIDSPNNLNINAVTVAISTDLTVGGDAYVGVDTSSGLILTSPNGTQYRLVVDNSGNLSTVLVP